VLLGCFPMSILAIPMFYKKKSNVPYQFLIWMKILFWVVMILFTIVETKIVHYSSMSYLPLSFLAASYIYFYSDSIQTSLDIKITRIAFLIIGLVFGIILTLVPLIFKNHHWITPYLKDEFAVASFQHAINWQGWEFVFGLLFMLGLFLALTYFNRNKSTKFLISLAFSSGITLLGYSLFIVPKIEEFSQGPAIEFYESLENKEVYVTTIGFKSYGHYFYTKMSPRDPKDGIQLVKQAYKGSLKNPKEYNPMVVNSLTNEWMLKGNIDKDVYFVTKITKREKMRQYTDIRFLHNKGGFDFYLRPKK